MSLRVRTDLFAASLLAVLGMAPVACGGSTSGGNNDDDGGSGASTGQGGATGTTGSGGKSTTGSSGSVSGSGGLFGSGGSSGGSIFGTGGASTVNRYPCESPTPLVDESTGYVTCSNGVIVRTEANECPSPLPRPDPVPDYDPALDQCQYDADCTDAPNGYCASATVLGGDTGGRSCFYGCLTDADCEAGSICLCDEPAGKCVASTCTSDADCASGFHCASYDPSLGCAFINFACQTSADTCASAADCVTQTCTLDVNNQRACVNGGCAIGRPFLVDDLARVAEPCERSDWLGDPSRPHLEGLDETLKAALAVQWLRAAELEHASIAAFARFMLELLAFGAPAELVAETARAMDDERRHTELCFSMASAYAGKRLGPGRLDVEGALETPELARSVLTTLREGCVGETVAALEAEELAQRVADPTLRRALAQIAADEKRHAELAFKFVKWALAVGGEAVRRTVHAELGLLEAEKDPGVELDDETEALSRAGVMTERLGRVLREAALRSAVRPALRALVGSSRPARQAA